MDEPASGAPGTGAERDGDTEMEKDSVAHTAKRGLNTKTTFAFLDESGFSDRPIVRYTWAKRGKTPVIPSAGGWRHRTVIGTLLCRPDGSRPRLVFTVQRKAVRAASCVRYLEKLKRRQRGRRLTLLWDGLPAHRAKRATAWIEENRHWLAVYRFPAYAPELNPAEYVWSATKTKDHAHRLAKDMPALERQIRKGLRRVSAANILRGCLKASGLY